MASLSEELAKLANPTPIFEDPEDNLDDVTAAKLVSKDSRQDEEVVTAPSKLRQRAAVLLADFDVKYAGEKTSRKALREEGSEEELVEDVDLDVEEDVGSTDGSELSSSEKEEEEAMELDNFHSKMNLKTQSDESGFSFEEDSDLDGNEDEDEEDSDDGEEEVGDLDEEQEKDEGVKSFSQPNLDEEMDKAQAVKQQLKLWDNFLEGRIRVQKISGLINQLPQPDTWETFAKIGGDNFSQAAKQNQKFLKNLLDQLINLQTLLLLQNKDTEHVVKGGHKDKKKADSDEEITSDSDTDNKRDEIKVDQKTKGMKRKLTMEEYPDFLAKRHTEFHNFRNTTVQKWNDKTRLAGGKLNSKSFSAFEQSAVKQIDQILSDKDRLIKRTQLRRSVYQVLGKGETPAVDVPAMEFTDPLSAVNSKDQMKDYDEEIFDDDDFYHQLLRELIEKKTTDISDPIALSRQWLEIQKLRNKVKKKVDTKASKGRRVRYDVHKKLLNFLAPVDTCAWTEESRDDLYKSLFGKRFQASTVSEAVSDR